jgi:hypothetical protein
MATLCTSALQRPSELLNVDWHRQIMAVCQESWLSIADVGDTLLSADPDFVPEDPTRKSRFDSEYAMFISTHVCKQQFWSY